MKDGRLLVQTNRPNVMLNLGITIGLIVLLILFVFSYVARAALSPQTPNQWVAAIFDNLPLIVLTGIPVGILAKIARDHIRMISHGYIAILDDIGIKVQTERTVQVLAWSDIVRFAIVDRIMTVGIDRTVRPGQRRIQDRKISLRYSSITNAEILRRVAYERPDLVDGSVRRDS